MNQIDFLTQIKNIPDFGGSVSVQVDSSGGTDDTYGTLSGLINGSNKVFTVSLGSYISGSLKVYLNGQLQTQGTAEDWTETSPSSGTFTFITAPTTGDVIIVSYQFEPSSPTVNADTLDGKHSSAFQLHDDDLDAIAALSPSNDDILQRKAGVWTNRSMAQLAADLTSLVFYTPNGLLWRVGTNPGGASLWTGTINGAPVGANVTLTTTAGNKGSMVALSTAQLAKMRLYNLTPGRTPYALISQFNTTTNVATLTANAPSNWASGDSMTIASQTVVGDYNWCDLEIIGDPLLQGRKGLQLVVVSRSPTVGHPFIIHPFETYNSGQIFYNVSVVANQAAPSSTPFKMGGQNLLSVAWTAALESCWLSVLGYYP